MAGIAFGAVLGALLGFVASLLTWWVQRRAQQHDDVKLAEQERARVRLLLREENEHNITSLKAFWRACTVDATLDQRAGYNPDELEYEHRLRLVHSPLPAWSTHFWETLGSAIPHALSDAEIRDTFALNAQLERFALLRVKILERLNQPESKATLDRYRWLRQVKRATLGTLDASTREHEQQILAHICEFNDETFADFRGEPGQPGCEGIQASVRNPIADEVLQAL